MDSYHITKEISIISKNPDFVSGFLICSPMSRNLGWPLRQHIIFYCTKAIIMDYIRPT